MSDKLTLERALEDADYVRQLKRRSKNLPDMSCIITRK